MGIIKKITIQKLWGIKDISTDLHENVNIFIGANGTSKTTFLNLIEAVLTVDIKVLYDINFEKMILEFSESAVNKLEITKKIVENECCISYSFDDSTKYEIEDINLSRSRLRFLEYSKYIEIVKHKISELVNLSWLSVNRYNSNFDSDSRDSSDRGKNMVDMKLDQLVKSLTIYRYQLETEVNISFTNFKEKVLSLMLYNEEFDDLNDSDLKKFEAVDTKVMQGDLFRAFKALGAQNKNSEILQHIQKIKDVISKIKNNETINIKDAFVLSLIKRTFSIIEISKRHEEEKKEIFASLQKFEEIIEKFMMNKKFDIINQVELNLNLVENNENIPISIKSLSSGEKQLFILLAETVLQKNVPYLYVADEPELSLHIEWQQKILKEILSLNPNAQIIVATHSPEIAGSYPENVINMKNITSYGVQCKY